MMTPLCELASKWNTDKTPLCRKGRGHSYTPYYYDLFRRLNVCKVLEIGIESGASLRLWEEYFSKAEIFGLDIRKDFLINEGRIRSFWCDQGDLESIRVAAALIGKNFDLIIDDGSHNAQHQVASAKILVPLLAPSGIYVIEDVSEPDAVTSQLPYKCEVKEFGVTLVPDDDRLVVIHKQ